VALVDDDMFVRTSLARQLEATRQVTVCGVYAGGAEGVAGITADPPEVVLMDIAMPDIGGIEAIRLIRAAAPALPILALTSLADQDSMLDILDAGAVGFLSKDLPVPTMVSAIQAARHGMSVLAPDAARQVVKAPAPRPQPALTDLETRILRLVCDGLTNDQIGERVHLSSSMVKRHVSSLTARFDATNRVTLAVKAAGLRLS
jgi:DNA-binding NarL/FixJ family response regulator